MRKNNVNQKTLKFGKGKNIMKTLEMKAKTIQPKNYGVWAINRETKEEEKFTVQAFTRQEAMKIVKEYKDEEVAEGYKIKVVAEICTIVVDGKSVDNFENECNKYIERCANAHITNNARSIGKVAELIEILGNNETLDKVLEVVGLAEFKQYVK